MTKASQQTEDLQARMRGFGCFQGKRGDLAMPLERIAPQTVAYLPGESEVSMAASSDSSVVPGGRPSMIAFNRPSR